MPQNGENAYLVMKNPRASRALRWALDPGQLGLSSFAQLCCVESAKRSKIFSLVPPLQKAGYGSGGIRPGCYNGPQGEALVDPRGGGTAGTCSPPPTGSNSFAFEYIFAEKHPHKRSAPPTPQRPPPNGKS